MKQGIYKIVGNVRIAAGTFRMTLEGDTSEFCRGGQFLDVAIEGKFLRRPFAVLEWDGSTMSIVYKVVGEGTLEMSRMKAGQTLDILTGLGNGFNASACRESALVVCGSIGASPTFSLVKELIANGKKVTVVLGFNTSDDVILVDEYKSAGADVRVATADGSLGIKGFVTDAIRTIDPEFDYYYTCGPMVMMKAVCAMLPGSGEASLEERMGCGCGICYGCTCHTHKGPRRICADGPVFKTEDIIW